VVTARRFCLSVGAGFERGGGVVRSPVVEQLLGALGALDCLHGRKFRVENHCQVREPVASRVLRQGAQRRYLLGVPRRRGVEWGVGDLPDGPAETAQAAAGVQLGGRIVQPATEVPGVTFGVFADAQGHHVGVVAS
jgi:hypothetical protein